MDERLTLLGLNEKEQAFYLAALQLGAASVTDVAARAGGTRTNGYDLLARLGGRGGAEVGAVWGTDVAARAGVTRTNGYDLLARLERRGLLSQSTESSGVRKVV